MATEVKLPVLAEGIESGDVLSVQVSEGDTINIDDTVIEFESEKATVPVPSTVKGRVAKVLVKAGDKVRVGETLIVVDEASGEADAEPPAESAQEPKKEKETAPADPPKPKRTPATEKAEPGSARVVALSAPAEAGDDSMVPAGPAVRRIAREIGIDLLRVRGSGRNGRIVVEDLDPYISDYVARRGGATVSAGPVAVELPDFSAWGPVHREKIDSLRRRISEHLSHAWLSIPHVHQFHEVDITDLIALQKRHKARVKELGGALTLTPFLMKALVIVLKEFPRFNASFDQRAGEVVFKDYHHIGVAVDTPGGLIVPVVRDVDRKTIVELAIELAQLAERTRERKVGIEDLRGGTFTISNLGGIGGSHFTPIVNSPEVAILGVGRSARKPVFAGDSVVGREILPVCVGYDHRVIDGADGARFIVRLGEVLENFEATFLGF
jgi:pyruvate dehydrogenase E2 component (dihydrolipoamide acetyltransferase)